MTFIVCAKNLSYAHVVTSVVPVVTVPVDTENAQCDNDNMEKYQHNSSVVGIEQDCVQFLRE